MPVKPPTEHRSFRERTQISWTTVVVFALTLALVDSFLVTTIQGAVGAIERTQGPFGLWVRTTLVLAPVLVGALAGTLLLLRRVFGERRTVARMAGTALLIVVVSSAVGTAAVSANSAWDYRLQSAQLAKMHSFHTAAAAGSASSTGSCDPLCIAKGLTRKVHVRAVRYGAVSLLLANVVLVLWLLALKGGTLWAPTSRRRTPVDESRAIPALA